MQIERNILEDWDIIVVLLMTLPGKSCENIGTRIGIVMRKISGVAIEGMKYQENTLIINEDLDDPNAIEEEELEEWDSSICIQFCKRIPWYPDYVVEDSCPEHCMANNPDWRKDHTDDEVKKRREDAYYYLDKLEDN